MAASVSASDAEGTSRRLDVARWISTVSLISFVGHYILSKPRASSQSVTAASKAASSTSAMFV